MVQPMTFRCIGIRRYVVEHPDGHSFGFRAGKRPYRHLDMDGAPVWNAATAPASQQAKHAIITAAHALAEREARARGDLSPS